MIVDNGTKALSLKGGAFAYCYKKIPILFFIPAGKSIMGWIFLYGKGENPMETSEKLLDPEYVQRGRPACGFSRKVFCEGMRDGVPIALGYFAVSFSLGIAARKAGFTPLQGFLASLLNNASAGEYAAFALIMTNAS